MVVALLGVAERWPGSVDVSRVDSLSDLYRGLLR